MTNISLMTDFFNWVEEKSKRDHYVYYLTFILVCLSLFFATPKYLFYYNYPYLLDEVWNTYLLKSQNLLDPLTHLNSDSHAAKLVFRLTVPVFIGIFGLSFLGAYALKFIAGVLLLFQLYKLSNKLLSDSVSATFLTSGFCFLYYGKACFIAYPTFDGIAFLCALLAMMSNRPILIFFLCTMAAWVDERALLALPIVLLFKQINTEESSSFEWKKLVALNSSAKAVLAAIVCYTAVRLFLTFSFDLHTPSESFSVFHQNVHFLGLGIWTFLEGFWFLYLIALVYSWSKGYYLFFAAIVAQSLASGVLASNVGDVTRSGSYLVPLVLVFVAFLRNHLSVFDMKYILFFCAVISFLFPAYYNMGYIDMQHPIYYDVFAYLVNRFG